MTGEEEYVDEMGMIRRMYVVLRRGGGVRWIGVGREGIDSEI